ncbi:MAG TPA: hypothetical protein DCG41_08450 [Verrucomicrobiales bacterium]|nr:hypothetical protein [Verrucomicrobiales bacterium]|tara:strand:+ start:1201 stop:1962 length:762 start_codon:yes stop_codon:yes gene_type:complete
MKPNPSDPFTATQGDPIGPMPTPINQESKQPKSSSSFQQEQMSEMPLDLLLEERLRKISLPSSSTDPDSVLGGGEPSPIRLMEPMEGFAIPSRAGTVLKPVTQTPEIDKPDPLAMPGPFPQSTTRLLTEPDVPLSADQDPVPLLQPVDESQLILRAIFGVGRDLNRDEILKKVSELPGIMSVKLLGRAELAALRVLRDGIQDLGVSLDLVSKEASVDLIHGEATTLVVFYEGEFRPGVREILTIVARQFSEID